MRGAIWQTGTANGLSDTVVARAASAGLRCNSPTAMSRTPGRPRASGQEADLVVDQHVQRELHTSLDEHTFEDVERLGYAERRPRPGRPRTVTRPGQAGTIRDATDQNIPGPEYGGTTERTSHAVTVSASPSGNGKAAGALRVRSEMSRPT
ncbi:hypothetical protein [Streptomyces pseudovenezuelae]|uniref:Transposase n=1 Tax=Streptomyces pseudovenezuelae TaxID=67350 RepID=A0ABT6LHK3_9ACTN|nr:hypothetical protein [Streptomyces pseudovenezuelae]MDH6215795.1 hypothetical protein [Streptomyces pseudovenezuelae]